jgi:hypothetical protein
VIILCWGVPFVLDLPNTLVASTLPKQEEVMSKPDAAAVKPELQLEDKKEEKRDDSGNKVSKVGVVAVGMSDAVVDGQRVVVPDKEVAGRIGVSSGAVEGAGGRGAVVYSSGRVIPPSSSALGVPSGETAVAEGAGSVGLGAAKGLKIVMIFEKGVMLDDGSKKTIGEVFMYEGVSETLACVNVDCGIVGFESGKLVRF